MFIPVVGCLLALVALGACRNDGRTLRPADPSQNASVFTPSTTSTLAGDSVQPVASDLNNEIDLPEISFVLQTPWADGGVIDTRYTCNGEGISPAITWIGAPAEAVSMALVVADTDSNDFVNWVIAGLDPKDPGLTEGIVPVDAIEGTNGFSTPDSPSIGWKEPCPPKGATHHYRFTLYALDQQIDLPTGAPGEDLISIIDSTSIQAAQVIGVYTTP
jgi:hypothetical protein